MPRGVVKAVSRSGPSSSLLAFNDLARIDRQIFVAYPYTLYKNERADYRKAFSEVEKALQVKFVYADDRLTGAHVLQKILDMIRSSEFGIYDITGWNPNVTLELGLALGVREPYFMLFNPTRDPQNSGVPADVGGIDRIQYTSFSDLTERVVNLVTQQLPIPKPGNAVDPLEQYRRNVINLFPDNTEQLSVQEIADELGIEVPLAQLVVRPLVGTRLDQHGVRRGTKYSKKALGPGRPPKTPKRRRKGT